MEIVVIVTQIHNKLLGIQTAQVQSTQKPCSKGFAEVNMQFRCSTAYLYPILAILNKSSPSLSEITPLASL
jgi:hypothetical protein